MAVYPVRIVMKQEKIIAKMIEQNARLKNIPIRAIYVPPKIKGYLFIEADNEEDVVKAVYGIRHVKGLIRKPLTQEELRQLFERKEEPKEEIDVGDIVEIIKGPFKGEKAKVTAVNKEKDVYTVLPLDVAIAIPVNLPGKNIKLIKRKEEGV